MEAIRSMEVADIDTVIALWRAAGLSHRPKGRDRRERIEGELAAESSVFLIAEEDGRILGAVFGTHDGRKGWINRVAVLPSHRRSGIGARLVAEVESRIHAMGIGIISCLIEGRNGDSQAFFDRLGYVRHEEILYFSKRQHADV